MIDGPAPSNSAGRDMADPLHLTIDRPRVVYRQISDQIRELIVTGKLAPGTKLPPSGELAAKWQTHAATIHAALTPLVKEGLLTRQPKIGTFVSKRRRKLVNVGIYYDSNIWLNQANAFKRSVHVELTRLLEAQRVNVTVWFDPRGEKQRGKTWAQLVRAVERREIQAILATDVPDDVVTWLQGLPVLSAYFTYAPVSNSVLFDFNQFAEASVTLLKKQGCRSVGMISILDPGMSTSSSPVTAARDFYEHFSKVCRTHGITVRNEWIRTAHGFVRDEVQEEFGYREFKEIWRQAERPEGLVIFPDTSVPGVIISLLEQRVNVPGELRLVAHKHAGIEFLCPLPITFLYSSARDIARAMIAQIERQFEGQTCEPVVLPFHGAPRGVRGTK